MSIPDFKPAKRFLGEYNIPCRVAKVENSKLPGIASRAIVIRKDDPVCEIYIRSKDRNALSSWENGILEQLFLHEGLGASVEGAMKEYGQRRDAYSDAKAAELEEIQKLGIAPFITIFMIVIDGVKKEAILRARTELDGNLIEHGISIYLQEGKWCFDYDDYYIGYLEKLPAKTDEDELERRQWSALFPRAKSGTPIEKDPTILYGKWEVDKVKTQKVFSALRYVNSTNIIELYSDQVVEFTSKTYAYSRSGRVGWQAEFLGCQRKGNRITVRCQDAKGKQIVRKYWLDDGCLVNESGWAFRRVK